MKYIIVGLGNIGSKRKAVLGNKCIATVDLDPKKHADYLSSESVPPKIREKIDAVVLSVSRKPKLELLKYWLSEGKHVLIEKPLVVGEGELKKLQNICKDKNVIWYTSYNIRLEPGIVKIKKMLEENQIGKLYHGRLTYGYGNVQEVKNTWRDSGFGVLDEIGAHLIDFSQYLLGYKPDQLLPLKFSSNEMTAFDHCTFITSDKKIIFSASALYWKNSFQIELYGEKGSLHLDGLCKWGKSTLQIHKRKLPSGMPEIVNYKFEGPDKSWDKDIKIFEEMIKSNQSSISSDKNTSKALTGLIIKYNPKFKTEKVLEKFQGDL